jgi:uncharacterized membrane protein
MRGLAVLIMIQCHVFNSFMRLDLRQDGAYILSQFVGGMAAPLFLFLAGITLAFQMDRMERKGGAPATRLLGALRRAGYVLLLAFLFRFSNWIFSHPLPPWQSMLRVDILNCMGFAMALLAPLALAAGSLRVRTAAAAGAAIGALSPLVNNADWGAFPDAIRNYFVHSHLGFAFFPCGAYVAFGIAIGGILRRLSPERLERTMQWAVLSGLAMVAGGQYFSTLPYSIYPKSNFWTDSPGLVVIRLGLMLAVLAVAFLWTEFGAGPGWSWVRSLGKTSLMVYWVHVVLVYGALLSGWKKSLGVAGAAAATIGITALMLGLSEARLRWKESILPWLRRDLPAGSRIS